MKYHFYILFSPVADKFYIGHTKDLEARLIRHNQKSKGFTGSVSDWEIIYSETFDNKSEAYARERQVKNWKSRDRVITLIEKNKK
jgi:putative endonuclease